MSFFVVRNESFSELPKPVNMKDERRQGGIFLSDLDKYVAKWKKAFIGILAIAGVTSSLGLVSISTK